MNNDYNVTNSNCHSNDCGRPLNDNNSDWRRSLSNKDQLQNSILLHSANFHHNNMKKSSERLRSISATYYRMNRSKMQVNRESLETSEYNRKIQKNIRKNDVVLAWKLLEEMFEKRINRNISTYNFLINTCIKKGDAEEADKFFKAMQGEVVNGKTYQMQPINPNNTTYELLIRVGIDIGYISRAWKVLDEMFHNGKNRYTSTYNYLIKTCAQAKNFEEADKFFKAMQGEMVNGKTYQTEPITPNRMTYDMLIKAGVKRGGVPRARKLFDEMMERKINLDTTTVNFLISTCANGEDVEQADMFFKTLYGEEINGKRHQIKSLKFTYQTYDRLIRAGINKGCVSRAWKLLEEMKFNGIKRSRKIYNKLIRTCVKNNDVMNASKFFQAMQGAVVNGKYYESEPIESDFSEYLLLIELQAKSGNLDKIENYLIQMQRDSKKNIYRDVRTILGFIYLACLQKNWSDVENQLRKYETILTTSSASLYIYIENECAFLGVLKSWIEIKEYSTITEFLSTHYVIFSFTNIETVISLFLQSRDPQAILVYIRSLKELRKRFRGVFCSERILSAVRRMDVDKELYEKIEKEIGNINQLPSADNIPSDDVLSEFIQPSLVQNHFPSEPVPHGLYEKLLNITNRYKDNLLLEPSLKHGCFSVDLGCDKHRWLRLALSKLSDKYPCKNLLHRFGYYDSKAALNDDCFFNYEYEANKSSDKGIQTNPKVFFDFFMRDQSDRFLQDNANARQGSYYTGNRRDAYTSDMIIPFNVNNANSQSTPVPAPVEVFKVNGLANEVFAEKQPDKEQKSYSERYRSYPGYSILQEPTKDSLFFRDTLDLGKTLYTNQIITSKRKLVEIAPEGDHIPSSKTVKTRKHLSVQEESQRRYARNRKLDIEKAQNTIKNLISFKNDYPDVDKEVFVRIFPTVADEWEKVSKGNSTLTCLWIESSALFDDSFFRFLFWEANLGKKIIIALTTTDYANFKNIQRRVVKDLYQNSPLFLAAAFKALNSSGNERFNARRTALEKIIKELLRNNAIPDMFKEELVAYVNRYHGLKIGYKGLHLKSEQELKEKALPLIRALDKSGMPGIGFEWNYCNEKNGLLEAMEKYKSFLVTTETLLFSSDVGAADHISTDAPLVIVAPMSKIENAKEFSKGNRKLSWIFSSEIAREEHLISYIENYKDFVFSNKNVAAYALRIDQLMKTLSNGITSIEKLKKYFHELLSLTLLNNYMMRSLCLGGHHNNRYETMEEKIFEKNEHVLKVDNLKMFLESQSFDKNSKHVYLINSSETDGVNVADHCKKIGDIFASTFGKKAVSVIHGRTNDKKRIITEDAKMVVETHLTSSSSFWPKILYLDPSITEMAFSYSLLRNVEKVVQLTFDTKPFKSMDHIKIMHDFYIGSSLEDIVLNLKNKICSSINKKNISNKKMCITIVNDITFSVEEKEVLEKLLQGINLSSADSLEDALIIDSEDEMIDEVMLPIDNTQKPIGLRNIGNSCYLDSVLEVLYSSKVFREIILNTEENGLREPGRADMLHQLKLLVNKTSNDQRLLKEAIFATNKGEFQKDTFYQQKDAASVLELLISTCIPAAMFNMNIITTTPWLIGYEFTKQESVPFIQIGIKGNLTLHEALSDYLIEKNLTEYRSFQPDQVSNAFANARPFTQAIQTNIYINSRRFEKLPQVLSFHFKRFTWNRETNRPQKLMHEVSLPEDQFIYITDEGIKDYQTYDSYDGLKAKYRIKGYIEHKGNDIDSGHYIAYTCSEDRYWECNDFKDPEEMAREQFLSNKQAYILLLEQVIVNPSC